ncbi:MAG: galactose ABC transporter substrate-binding protein [Galactobacillus timonensis]|uniref:galactose ABC transporter substrate-binding protein n=2 Tax=Galactobacillus timonensis TaxID=2041840 RepID=UPI002409D037|nr:galactose ABC transporter substrate-binding protein [Galactobacillus timonensis]MDD5852178.1 galactose ABC transporter substrate-binding protein [Galactobacillus timonensis]MDD6448373.1 galactose ABC transporter substrate-binding protein [Lachnospiraceae bacterium]MDD6600741.1 galactose ABC transporter substrate-binding protein [Galactobacillus timonensis]MDD6681459.1 galactose ABC transporter substrate-binding protein [Galactobacillus timonensis]
MELIKKAAVGILTAAMIAGCGSSSAAAANTAAASSTASTTAGGAGDGSAHATAGVVWYNFADTFISNARAVLNNVSKADGTVTVTDADSQNDTTIQDNNMNNIFTQHPDFFVLNNINNAATSQIVEAAKKEDITTIFANTTSPSDEDFANYDKLWYVSSASEQSGQNMGNEIVDYFNSHDNWDRNGNGKVDFILLQGMPTFSDTINRSSYSLAAIEAAGYTLGTNIGGEDVTGVKGGDSITGVICDFQRQEAQENVEALLSAYGDDIDCILADNDDEALGAIAALQAHGYLTDDSNYIPVVGVDATAAGCEAIKNGTMLGTSLNNPVKLGKAVYKVMYLLTKGEEVTTESIGMEGVNVTGHKVIIDYVPITKDNVDDANYDINDTSF